ncbi:MAG: hypothetical protein ACLFQV_04445 [Vulcanimicrobiota bacterium]
MKINNTNKLNNVVSRGKPSAEGKPAKKKPENSSVHSSGSIGVDMADKFEDSPFKEKLSGALAGVLVYSGVKEIIKGVKEKDRDKFLSGSKKTMWGAYHALSGIDTVFKTALSITPGLRALGGFINADLGLTALYKDYKDNKKIDSEKALFHAGVTAWGLRHVALGMKGLAKSNFVAGLAKGGNQMAKDVALSAPVLGAVGAGIGIAAGALDTAFGVKNLVQGIRENDKKKKVLGSVDIAVGVAMGASCVLSGIPGIVALGVAGVGEGISLWVTNKEDIKKYYKYTKEKVKEIGHKIGQKLGWVSDLEKKKNINKLKTE